MHYAGMSGEGVGKASASLLAPASPAALIDGPCATAAGPGGRRPLSRHSPLLEQGQQPDVPGLWGAGVGAGKTGSRPGGSRPDVEPLTPLLQQLGSGGFGSAVDLLACGRVSPGLDSVQNWGWWSSPAQSCWVRHAAASKEETVPLAQGSCDILARAPGRGVARTWAPHRAGRARCSPWVCGLRNGSEGRFWVGRWCPTSRCQDPSNIHCLICPSQEP